MERIASIALPVVSSTSSSVIVMNVRFEAAKSRRYFRALRSSSVNVTVTCGAELLSKAPPERVNAIMAIDLRLAKVTLVRFRVLSLTVSEKERTSCPVLRFKSKLSNCGGFVSP